VTLAQVIQCRVSRWWLKIFEGYGRTPSRPNVRYYLRESVIFTSDFFFFHRKIRFGDSGFLSLTSQLWRLPSLHCFNLCGELSNNYKTELLSPCFLNWLIIRSWRWRRNVPPKRWLTLKGLHGVVSQKQELFIITAVRTTDHRGLILMNVSLEGCIRSAR
jgi:hypothetical protein